MDDDKKNVPRKVRFAPKAPPRRDHKLVLPKLEKFEEADAAKAEQLMQRFNEASVKIKPKLEQKPKQVQVAFGRDEGSSIKSYGALKGKATLAAGGAASGGRGIKEYKEPWDYYTNYPVTLPLRRPYSGDPELLNEEEFRETLENITCTESSINSAIELGLMEEDLEANMLFLQFPENMPVTKQSVKKEGLETINTSKPVKGPGASGKACNLNELPAGFMGKMLVYKSGAIKLKLGDILYDVSAGLNNVFSQDAVVINTEEKHCCVVGELNKRAIVSPNLDSVLDSVSEL